MIIRPSKHNDPDKTLIYATFLILKKLKNKKIMPYEELLSFIQKEIVSREYLFLPALSFLFLLGLIDYQAKTDMIEYIEQKQ